MKNKNTEVIKKATQKMHEKLFLPKQKRTSMLLSLTEDIKGQRKVKSLFTLFLFSLFFSLSLSACFYFQFENIP